MKRAHAETITPPLDGFASGTLVLVGTTPLLMHSDRTVDTGAKRAASRRSADEEAEAGTYRMRGGTLCIYARHLLAAIRDAADIGGYRIHGRHALAKTLDGALILTPAELAVGAKKYVIDRRNVGMQGGNRVPRARARIWPWKVTCTVHYYTRVLSRTFMGTTFPELVERAGVTQGLLDYRPACRGDFGRFKAQSWRLT